MILNNEWKFLLDLKKTLENWYWKNDDNKDNKINLNIVTNLNKVNLTQVENTMFMNKHYGDFYETSFLNVQSDDNNIIYKLEFLYRYRISKQPYLLFFKRKVVEDLKLETTIDGVFYNRKNWKNLEYNNFLQLKDEILKIETLIKYLENFYLNKKY